MGNPVEKSVDCVENCEEIMKKAIDKSSFESIILL